MKSGAAFSLFLYFYRFNIMMALPFRTLIFTSRNTIWEAFLRELSLYLKFEVPIAIKSTGFWYVTPCSPVKVC
jgi:hypothetical protein